jgi:hypothetical protein
LLALIFFVWTLIAFGVAYDRPAALGRLAGITAGMGAAALILLLGRRSGSIFAVWAGLGCLLLAALIAGYFLLTYDWQAAGAGKFAPAHRLGLWVQAHRPAVPLPFTEDINGNVAGGALVILLPLGLGAAFHLLRGRRRSAAWWLGAFLVAGLSLLTGIALVLSLSRGAWIAFVLALLAALYVGWRQRSTADHRRLDRLVFWGFVGALIGAFALAVSWPAASPELNRLEALFGSTGVSGAGGSAIGRVTLWRDMLTLVRDYPFTGSGLGATMMVFSSYVLMLHVGYIMHAHHLLLQIAVEQGLPAMLAFATMFGLSLWVLLRATSTPDRAHGFPLPAAVAALVALAVHGTVDAGLYVSRLAPLVFLPFGFAALAATLQDGAPTRQDHLVPTWPLWITVAAVSMLLAAALLPPVRSAMQSNLAAVAQTRAELSVYEWPAWPLQDAVRRSGQVNLDPAMRRFAAALALDPGNASAARRLGQIELSLGQYDRAAAHIQTAFAGRPSERASRQLMGEVKAIGGAVEEAAALWRTINLAQHQPDLRSWWYTNVGEPDKAERITQAARMAGW